MSYHPYPKRDPVKNYCPVPNELYHLGLSVGAIAVYGYLLHIEDRKTYQCYESYKTIGEAVKMSANTVAKYVPGTGGQESYPHRTHDNCPGKGWPKDER